MDDFITYWPWLFLLLPVAYLFGWLKGRRSRNADNNMSDGTLSSDYFKGLNYLLADQQDKALPVFLQLVKVDNETIDTHLALATIFRRSGKLDQAIEVHQNLIARPSLSANYRSKSLLELGRDYLAAGLFDRAEGLFNDVIKSGFYAEEARRFMLTIYQQEKEWDEAIKVAKALIQQGDSTLRPLIAQFYCELSESYIDKGNKRLAEETVRDALAYYPACIRALIIKARIALAAKKYKEVIKLVKQVEQTDPDYFPSVLPYCVESYRELSRISDLITYLKTVDSRQPDLNLMEIIVSLLNESGLEEDAFEYLQQQLNKSPNVNALSAYLELLNKQQSLDGNNCIQAMKPILEKMKNSISQYQCRKCGYTSGTLNWQCPSCHSWGEIKPVTSIINAKN